MVAKTAGLLISAFLVCINNLVSAQDFKEIAGSVTTFRHFPLNNVKVVSSVSGDTVFTDPSGKFRLKSLRNDRVKISAYGFDSKEITVKKKGFYNIDLVYFDDETNFKAATGNGHITAENLLKALNDSIKTNQRDFSKYGSIYELISSEVYNVRVNGNTILNTKIRSFDQTPQLLLVVDDKIVTDISFIDPSWVSSIELIDDVRSSLYGSMGANGVLRIVLKSP